MSKELVISAASHERRVAILEEGQLVEIYIEREKEFALVGSIYKGRVTRVLPGMQSAFVDIGLDGDAFLYVSDVFENLEDYDSGHSQGEHLAVAPLYSPPSSATVEVLPGETLARAGGSLDQVAAEEVRPQEVLPEEAHQEASAHDEHGAAEEAVSSDESAPAQPADVHDEPQPIAADERQPDSNASAPQNFTPQYNPTQNYPSRSDRGGERSGQDYGRGGDRGGDRGRGGRWGRRGGRRRGGGRHQGPGGRNLPPSKYASPQGSEPRGGESRGYDQRGYENRGGQSRGFEPRGSDQRGYDNRRQDSSRYSGPSDATEEPILLPGESLAKYRGKPPVPPAPPVSGSEPHDSRPESEDTSPRASGNLSPSLPTVGPAGGVPRRFSGGLPRWVLADAGSETEIAPAADSSEPHSETQPQAESETHEAEPAHNGTELSEDQAIALASELVEAKHEETQERADADALVGGAEFEEAEESVETEEPDSDETTLSGETDLSEEEAAEAEQREAVGLADAEAEAAHESAEHVAALGETEVAEPEQLEAEVIEASSSERLSEPPIVEEEIGLLPGETRAPRSSSPSTREEYPRDSARIGSSPRSRFQRPNRGGRDRGRDNRGGRPDRRGGRPRFERRGPGGPHRHHGGHAGPPRRPQLISEMLKAGQDVVVQIAKEPLGKKGARITSHIALPGRFLVYMPTIDHIGVSRKIASAENRSRLRRLVGEARGAYPGGFIVRTAAGGATDEEIRTDIEFLGKTWNEIKQKSEERKAPALLHRDLNLVERILRDYVSDDFTAIWIDSEEEYGKVVEFVSRFQPKLVSRVKLYTKETPIFEEFGIQHELDKALRAKVWLKSGGYIVINHTEALVAIDVNTGKFVGKGSTRLEDTIVKTNLEAVKEIVRQIRLRDLGGIIVVDFIDMEERRNREKVLMALQQALEQDKAPSKALSFNEFGLVCITRKRTKQALERVLCQPCPYCTGSGMVKSIPTLCYEIQAEARKMAMSDHEGPNLTLRVHPEIAKALKTRESMLIDELEQNSHKHVIIQSDATLHWEQYDIY
jgi:Rne/Rng family ribonuclease